MRLSRIEGRTEIVWLNHHQTAIVQNLSEKGLLTPDNCVLALIAIRPNAVWNKQFRPPGNHQHTVAIGKAARVFDVPVVLTTVETNPSAGICGRNREPYSGDKSPSSALP